MCGHRRASSPSSRPTSWPNSRCPVVFAAAPLLGPCFGNRFLRRTLPTSRIGLAGGPHPRSNLVRSTKGSTRTGNVRAFPSYCVPDFKLAIARTPNFNMCLRLTFNYASPLFPRPVLHIGESGRDRQVPRLFTTQLQQVPLPHRVGALSHRHAGAKPAAARRLPDRLLLPTRPQLEAPGISRWQQPAGMLIGIPQPGPSYIFLLNYNANARSMPC